MLKDIYCLYGALPPITVPVYPFYDALSFMVPIYPFYGAFPSFMVPDYTLYGALSME